MDLLLAAARTILPLTFFRRREILAYQSERLKVLVHHAYSNLPLYRKLFDTAGVHPEQIRSIGDLHLLPLLPRDELQGSIEERLASGTQSGSLIWRRTSGSSGVPVSIARTRAEDRLLMAVRLRELHRLGLRPWDLRVSVDRAHAPDSATVANAPLRMHLGLLRRYSVSCMDTPEEILQGICRAQPHVIEGFAGSLALIARSLRKEHKQLVQPRFLVSGAEKLTPSMRNEISEAFRAPVYDFYGSHEFNLISAECAATGRQHLMETSVITEVLRDGKPVNPFESGELVATALHSFAMPFIRYRLGDIVTLGESPCPCGAPVRTLVSVDGRQIELFIQPSGRTLHPYILLSKLLEVAPWLHQYQLVQKRRDLVVVIVRPRSGTTITAEDLDYISTSLMKVLEKGVAVRVEIVPEIRPEANGKFRPYYTLAT